MAKRSVPAGHPSEMRALSHELDNNHERWNDETNSATLSKVK